MKSFSIIILAVIFLSSFNSKKDISFSDAQLVLTDTCRLSKIYLNEKVKEEFIYNGRKKLIRANYNSEKDSENLEYYIEVKYDSLDRLVDKSTYRLILRTEEFVLFQKRKYIYNGNSNLIAEMEVYMTDSEYRPEIIRIEKFTYNSKGLLVKSQFVKVKKKRKKINREPIPVYREFIYDNRNNPISIERYNIVDGQKETLEKIEVQFDSIPNSFPIFLMDLPVISTNNIIKSKTTTFYNDEEKIKESGFDIDGQYQFSNEGLVLNRKIRTNGKIYLYEYEYICD